MKPPPKTISPSVRRARVLRKFLVPGAGSKRWALTSPESCAAAGAAARSTDAQARREERTRREENCALWVTGSWLLDRGGDPPSLAVARGRAPERELGSHTAKGRSNGSFPMRGATTTPALTAFSQPLKTPRSALPVSPGLEVRLNAKFAPH